MLPSAAGSRFQPSCHSVTKSLQAELSRERATVLVVDHGDGPVGWAVGWAVPGELHVMNIAVHPDHRRRGHARALLAALIDLHGWVSRIPWAGRLGMFAPYCRASVPTAAALWWITACTRQCRPCALLLCSNAESALLEVRISNEPALSLYRSMGFQHVGLRPKYYQASYLLRQQGKCTAVAARTGDHLGTPGC